MSGRGEDIRSQILTCADRLFQERGYASTSFQDLATSSGIPKGNFYYHFRTKNDVLLAMLAARCEALREKIAAIEAANSDPVARLVAFAGTLPHDSDKPFLYGCPHGSLCIELAKGQRDLLDQASEPLRILRKWIAGQFKAAGMAKGAQHLSLELIARMQGIITVATVFHDASFARREIKKLQSWLDGLRVDEVTSP